jgi:hypothetical protein
MASKERQYLGAVAVLGAQFCCLERRKEQPNRGAKKSKVSCGDEHGPQQGWRGARTLERVTKDVYVSIYCDLKS